MKLSRAASLRVLSAGAACLVGFPSRARAADSLPVRVGVIPSDFAAQSYYARDMGIFAKLGLAADVVPVTSGPAAAAAVVSGSLDFAYSNIISLAIAHDKAFPFVAVAIANIYRSDAPAGGLIGVKQTSDIKTAKDFNGRSIAVGAINNITHLGARAWIDANGGDSTLVHWPEFQISTMAPAVLAGRIDGAVLDQGVYPTLGKAGDPIRVIAHAYDAIAPQFAIGVWFTTADWAAKHPAETHAFATAMGQAATWANAHHHESAQILAKATGQSAEQIDAGSRYAYGTSLAPQLLQPSINVAAKYGVIKTAFPAKDLSPMS